MLFTAISSSQMKRNNSNQKYCIGSSKDGQPRSDVHICSRDWDVCSASFPLQQVLHMATGLAWTQCEDCQKMGQGSCSRQAPPLFRQPLKDIPFSAFLGSVLIMHALMYSSMEMGP
ncbi:hypothetical protein Salat_2231200 [Sesamum alatum]|uniref:Uncharacterized protein n=1 Tax=Sesamum alatum TaxID=300844 RepID=A0AAE1XUA6_9LAMI|nr:hypothetical protein Salat_2231200 [Sesamum alatum]